MRPTESVETTRRLALATVTRDLAVAVEDDDLVLGDEHVDGPLDQPVRTL